MPAFPGGRPAYSAGNLLAAGNVGGNFRALAREGTITRLTSHFTAREPWLFVGCGSSYYLSQLVCAIWMRDFSIPCMAVPASELLFAPEETLRRSGATQVVFVSRSGETTEVMRAANCCGSAATCELGRHLQYASPFDHLCTHVFTLPWADEKSTVMTSRSHRFYFRSKGSARNCRVTRFCPVR